MPKALVGSPVPADQVCVDIDPRKGADVRQLADHCECDLPDTMAVISGRLDGGIHLFWNRPLNADGEFLPLTETKMQKKLGEGFDLKTSTGYTILLPSLHPDTGAPYEWRGDYQNPLEYPVCEMPAKLAELLIADPSRPRRPGSGAPNPRALEGILRRVAEEASTRNKVVFWGACRLVENNYPETAFDALADAAAYAGLPDREITKTINSAIKGVGA